MQRMARCRCTLKTLFKLFVFSFIVVFIYALTNYKARILFSQPDFMFEDSNFFMISNNSQKCRLKQSDLNAVTLNISPMTVENVSKANPEVQKGGKWKPDCEAWQKVAIIVPYRDRPHHLPLLLNRLHPMLRKQKIDYQIFFAIQAGDGHFNRGRLFNIGYLEAMKHQNFDCLILHDVDLLPETDKNIYACDTHARHLASAIDEQRYHPVFNFYYGGVTAISKENFENINGFANRYAGWGNEDDDMSARTIGAGLLLTRPPYHIGRYKMVRHMKAGRSEHGYTNFLQWRHFWKIDGLSNMKELDYKVLSVTEYHLYTNITIDVGKMPHPPQEDIAKEPWWWFLWFYVP